MIFFLEKIAGKLMWYVLLAIGGIVFAIKRFMISAAEKHEVMSAIKKIKERNAYAREYAEGVDMPYSKREDFLPEQFDALKKFLGRQERVGKYAIEYTIEISKDEFLLFARLWFEDYDIGATGAGTSMHKTVYIPFLLRYIPGERKLDVRSNMFHDMTERFQRQEFLPAVLNEKASPIR